MIKMLTLVAVLAAAQNAATPPSTTVSEPRRISEEAMKFVANDDMSGLFRFLGGHMPMKKGEMDAIHKKFVELRKPLPDTLGKVLGYAFIKECRRSDFLMELTFVEKREKNVLRWQFIFYRPRNSWHISYLYMDENYSALFTPCS